MWHILYVSILFSCSNYLYPPPLPHPSHPHSQLCFQLVMHTNLHCNLEQWPAAACLSHQTCIRNRCIFDVGLFMLPHVYVCAYVYVSLCQCAHRPCGGKPDWGDAAACPNIRGEREGWYRSLAGQINAAKCCYTFSWKQLYHHMFILGIFSIYFFFFALNKKITVTNVLVLTS